MGNVAPDHGSRACKNTVGNGRAAEKRRERRLLTEGATEQQHIVDEGIWTPGPEVDYPREEAAMWDGLRATGGQKAGG